MVNSQFFSMNETKKGRKNHGIFISQCAYVYVFVYAKNESEEGELGTTKNAKGQKVQRLQWIGKKKKEFGWLKIKISFWSIEITKFDTSICT